MPGAENKENLNERGAPDEDNAATLGENVRRPYRAPHLRYLGSVREITAGNVSLPGNEGPQSRKNPATG